MCQLKSAVCIASSTKLADTRMLVRFVLCDYQSSVKTEEPWAKISRGPTTLLISVILYDGDLQTNSASSFGHGYLSGARCRLAYSPADAAATHCHLLQ